MQKTRQSHPAGIFPAENPQKHTSKSPGIHMLLQCCWFQRQHEENYRDSISFQEVLLFRRHYPDTTLTFSVPRTVTDGGGLKKKQKLRARPLLCNIQSIGKAGKATRWQRPEMEVVHGSEQGLQEVLGEKALQSAREDTSPSTRYGASRKRK